MQTTIRSRSIFISLVLVLGSLFVLAPLAHASGTATIQSLSPSSSVNVGNSVTFSVATTGFTNPYFQVSDSVANSSVTGNDINYYGGNFLWNPVATDAGTHTITVTVRDSSGDSAVVSQQIVVNPAGTPALAIEFLSPASTVTAAQTVSFFVVPSSFKYTNPSYSVSDSFSGTSVTSGDINSAGKFTWTPTSNDVGTHVLTLTANDSSGENASVQETITVTPSTSTTTTTSTSSTSSGSLTLSIQSLTPIAVGQELALATQVTGFSNPSYTVSDSFSGSTVSNSDISSSGAFTWTPSASDIGTHTITIQAADTSGHTLTTSETVIVQPALTTTSTVTTVPVSTSGVSTTSATPTTPTYLFSTTMSSGDQSTDVTNLQNFLTQNGLYSGPITGYYGSLTVAAVKAFQTAHGISALGNVGPQTLAAINSLGTSTTDTTPNTTTDATTTSDVTFTSQLSSGSTGAEVTALQNKLTSLGLYSGPITGYYGSLTVAAVKAFQTAHSLSPVGYTGPATRAALMNS